jgi:hypothetical protein
MVYARHPLLTIYLSPPVPPLPSTSKEQEDTRGQKKRKERSHDREDDDNDNTWSYKPDKDHATIDYATRRQADELHMTNQVKPNVLQKIGKAQKKNQKDYQRKRAKISVKNRNKDSQGDEITAFEVGDMVTITPRVRAPKRKKTPVIYKVITIGKEKTTTQGKTELTDDSVPPQTWWEATSNIGLFMRASEFEHRT